MSSDLEQLRDHARRMADEQHTSDCLEDSGHLEVDTCPGCMSESERALWAQIAAEITSYQRGTPPRGVVDINEGQGTLL